MFILKEAVDEGVLQEAELCNFKAQTKHLSEMQMEINITSLHC
jgi:hypothetical protein